MKNSTFDGTFPKFDWISLSILLGTFLSIAAGGFSQPPDSHSGDSVPYGGVKPYADFLAKPYEYHGSKRGLGEPIDVEEVRIGLFVPLRGHRKKSGLSMHRGAEVAIVEANGEGGCRGKPFKLILRSDDQIWGSAKEVVKLAYEDKVWAVMGSIGGESTHIAEQIITKAHVPLISPASTDCSLTQVNIPWMFRCMPDDEHIARVLGDYLFRDRGYKKVVGIAAKTYDSRLGMEEFEKIARRLGTPLVLSLKYNPGDNRFSRQLRLIKHSEAQALVIWGQPGETAQLIRQMREQGMAQAIFGGPELAFPAFPKLAGVYSEGITVVVPCNLWRDDAALLRFNRRSFLQYGEPPDVIAAYAYDGMNFLIQAIRAAGLNRAKIRDAMTEIKVFHGVTGEMRFDGSGSNISPPVLAVVRDGRFVPLSSSASKDNH